VTAPAQRQRAVPSDTQLLLLRVATARDAAVARAAWARCGSVDLDVIDGESFRLLPLCYKNLRRLGVSDALDARLPGLYKQTWVKNHLVLGRATAAVGALARMGIPTLILKGGAMVLLHYRDAGVRVMEDIDLLVPTEAVLTAADALATVGFHPGPAVGTAPPFDEDHRALHHSYPFSDRAGNGLDLHWYLSAEARRPGVDQVFWLDAVPVTLDGGVQARALAPTDQLYHVCAHAANSNTPHVRWMADAVTVMRAHAIDWKRLAGHARSRRMVPALRDALGVLAIRLDAPVPRDVLEELRVMRTALVDRVEHAHNVSARPYTLAAVALRLWCWHRRGAADEQQAWSSFPRFLERYYGVEDGRALAALALRRAASRLRREGLL
jgi:Uncharacterised nucleotidyltransferase